MVPGGPGRDVPACGSTVKVLFLDVDGVLNHAGCMPLCKARMFDPACCDLIRQVVAETDCSIVVSSTWRLGETLESLKAKLFTCGLAVTDRIIGMTPDLVTPRIKGPDGEPLIYERVRGHEIGAWLDDHPEVTRYVIVDDDSDMAEHLPRLVRTTWKAGLEKAHARRIIRMLNED
jgi:hypothetical protein